ncbi:MAG: thioredoxin-disulfide reductase [Candidatus Woesearchaeota archaeon]
MKEYDVIIVGAGAAGLTAAIYTCRKRLKTAVISVDIGGQMNLTTHIENYPGVEPMAGAELVQRFKKNALSFGAEFIMGKVARIDKEGNAFKVLLSNNDVYQARAVILAFGAVPRELGIPGESKFLGRGLSTCATCDAPLYKNKVVAVIGGGNSAIEGALELVHAGAKQVYLVHRRNEFRGDEVSVEKVKKEKCITIITPYVPLEIVGDKFVTGLKIRNVETNEEKLLAVNGVFKEIGYAVDVTPVKHLVKINEKNEIVIDANNCTSVPGIFAAGDVTTVPYKQAVISAGEGAKAALSCYKYLVGDKAVMVDWEKKK